MPARKPAKKPARKPSRKKVDPAPPTNRALGFTKAELEGRRPILFWTKSFDPNLFVDRADDIPATRRRSVVAKLKRGKLVMGYRGASQCRVCGKRLGSADLGNAEWLWPQGAEHYITEHGVWFPLLDEFAGAAAAKPVSSATAGRRKKTDRYAVLGAGMMQNKEEGRVKRRPFVVVQVAPDKVRPFYMSTGTGGQTEAGEWNLFGGIASGAHLGWVIKPYEGKRVAKYADVAAFLTETFSADAEKAWKRLRARFPKARVYASDDKDESLLARRARIKEAAAKLNRYLIDLDAIADFEAPEREFMDRDYKGKHRTVRHVARVEPEPAPRRRKKVDVEEAVEVVAKPSSRRRSSATDALPTGGVMLAKKYERGDVRGWWMSEKFDGMRAYWTGSALFTRNGNKIHAPKWFTDALPDMALDGELMLGRGKFQETMSIVRKQTPVDKDWRKITFYVFDAPMERGGCEDRWAAATRAVRGIKHVKMVEQVACKSPAHLKKVHDEIAALGGEGVMLREPGSPYEHRRSGRLLKVKMFDDNEARITGYEAGKGKHAGRLGAYKAVLTTGPHKGKKFTVGTGMSDAERERPLRVGTIITVKHQGYSDSGSPRFPSFLRVRGKE